MYICVVLSKCIVLLLCRWANVALVFVKLRYQLSGKCVTDCIEVSFIYVTDCIEVSFIYVTDCIEVSFIYVKDCIEVSFIYAVLLFNRLIVASPSAETCSKEQS
jgi:hypothetical protein